MVVGQKWKTEKEIILICLAIDLPQHKMQWERKIYKNTFIYNM